MVHGCELAGRARQGRVQGKRWEAKSVKGDYHDEMTDGMFMERLAYRLTPAFKAPFGDKRMILVLDHAPDHHDIMISTPRSRSRYQNRTRRPTT